jgi:hypothetical membrane protein
MNRRTASAFGVTAPLLYVGAVILGGALWPQYSHLKDPISLLASSGAPHALLMNVLFIVYDVVLTLFGLTWWFAERRGRRPLSAALVSVIGILGLLMYFFRQDAAGSDMTATGLGHVILAASMSLLTMAAIVLRGRAELHGRPGAALYSFASLGVVFVTGGLAAVSIARHWTYGGVFERVTIGTFLLWVLVEALMLANRVKPAV